MQLTQTDLLQKVQKGLLSICSLQLDFSGVQVPSISGAYQNFYDTNMDNMDFFKTYFTGTTLSLSEESKDTSAGTKYLQSLVWSFPNNDRNRSLRIAELIKVKYVKLVLSDGNSIVLGRNDFFQNARPKIKTQSDHLHTSIEFDFVSIFPFGFLEGTDDGDLYPLCIPITFINL